MEAVAWNKEDCVEIREDSQTLLRQNSVKDLFQSVGHVGGLPASLGPGSSISQT